MNDQELKEMFEEYMCETKRQTAVLQHIEEQQEIIIDQTTKCRQCISGLNDVASGLYRGEKGIRLWDVPWKTDFCFLGFIGSPFRTNIIFLTICSNRLSKKFLCFGKILNVTIMSALMR